MSDLPKTLLEMVGAESKPSTLKESVLVLIDIQNEYLPDGNAPLENVESAIEESSKLLKRARDLNIPIVHVAHHGPPGKGFFDPEAKGGEFCDSVKPLESEYIVKKNYVSSFVGTNMKEILENTGKKELIVIGFMTHNCLNTFVRAATEEHGFKCTVVGSCTATRDLPSRTKNGQLVKAKDLQESSLASLLDYFACVVDRIDEIAD